MRRVIWFIVVGLWVVAGCSDAGSKETYTIDDAEQNGDVIVEHEASSFDQIVQGALEVQHAEKVVELLDKVESEEKANVDISIFEPGGSHHKNSISYDGKQITFENNYEGYQQTPVGTFQCDYISLRGPIVYLSSCQADDGTEHSTLIGLVGTEKAFRESDQ
ncbi:hypothetical protein [Sediminibacillus massiliensis]|uniref:hypothetical protein n=1 Tax=Sediminibacillus massiliensis TaxID=1926277 RepID=UPI00098840CF|nr:hypothetical protein [Sediminibacillus massiliensis]